MHLYEVLKRPLQTEKTMYLKDLRQYGFEVDERANKQLVKDAVETMFDVDVVKVNMLNTAPKRGRRARSRRLLVRKPGFKKAIVTLAEGQTLEIFEGVK